MLLGWPDAEGLVCDMGGASMELAHVRGGAIGDCATSPLGPLKLADIPDPRSARSTSARCVKELRAAVPGAAPRLFLVGGSWRAIARLDMERVGYPLKVLHGYEPPIAQLLEIAEVDPRPGAGGDVGDDRHLDGAAVAGAAGDARCWPS